MTEVPFVYMERAGFMTCTAASHQGAIKEPAASLLRTSETHPGALQHNTANNEHMYGEWAGLHCFHYKCDMNKCGI